MTDHASDGVLLDRWRSGDSAAFAALVERFQAPLLRHARSVLGNGRGHEDVVQEAFLRLAQHPPDRRADGEIGAWLHTVTRNLCMDILRNESRRRVRESEHEHRPPSASADGLELAEAADTREAVQRSLDRLPEDQREVLVLRILGEKSYAEIASITGRKVGTIGWMISVGLKALARDLSKQLAPLLAPGDEECGRSAARLDA